MISISGILGEGDDAKSDSNVGIVRTSPSVLLTESVASIAKEAVKLCSLAARAPDGKVPEKTVNRAAFAVAVVTRGSDTNPLPAVYVPT